LRIYNRYIISLAVAACVINPLLALFNQNDIVIYLTINIVAYLAITLLYVQLNSRARRALNLVSAVYFGIFLIAVGFEVVKILVG
jgi:uncharacterized BrkB/YihY/UPF0761 family membrane protein